MNEQQQVAGKPCVQCETRVTSVLDGAPCPECHDVVHVADRCWRTHAETQHPSAEGHAYRRAPAVPRPSGFHERSHERPSSRGAEADLLCTGCSRRVFAPTKKTFLGFPSFACPECHARVLHPLSGRRRIFYYAFATLSLGLTVWFLLQGTFALPGGLAILAFVGLVKDRTVTQQFERAELVERTTLPKTKRKKRSTEKFAA